ncbi:MAG: hypothetical protein Kow001_15080 [Acidobacteriota bacterium]
MTGAALLGAPWAAKSAVDSPFSPLAITMWDFSWLERRWPGAGYEDWDQILDELVQRGYNAVRIDAYPHLVAYGPEREWTLEPCWNQQDWGSPALNRVRVQPALNNFIGKCRARGIRVGLSTWFRRDTERSWERITSPEEFGRIWKVTLDGLAADNLLDALLYVDLCNEYPLDVWVPWFPQGQYTSRRSPQGKEWMTRSLEVVRKAYPDLRYTFSFTSEYENWEQEDVSFLDFLELHLWMTHFTDFYQQVGYRYERFESTGYENLVRHGERLYREKPDYWQGKLREGIEMAARWSRASGKPLITTECWSVVDYKDWPLLSWDWIKELCEVGVRQAASTGRWVAMATSNFCGPQFAGMWRDVDWHLRLTRLIRASRVDAEVVKSWLGQ